MKLAGEEFQADAGCFQMLGQGGQFQTAAEALVFVDDEGDRAVLDPEPFVILFRFRRCERRCDRVVVRRWIRCSVG